MMLTISASVNSPEANSGPAGLFCPPLRQCATSSAPFNVAFMVFPPSVKDIMDSLIPSYNERPFPAFNSRFGPAPHTSTLVLLKVAKDHRTPQSTDETM